MKLKGIFVLAVLEKIGDIDVLRFRIPGIGLSNSGEDFLINVEKLSLTEVLFLRSKEHEFLYSEDGCFHEWGGLEKSILAVLSEVTDGGRVEVRLCVDGEIVVSHSRTGLVYTSLKEALSDLEQLKPRYIFEPTKVIIFGW
jgi:hypothetical protein